MGIELKYVRVKSSQDMLNFLHSDGAENLRYKSISPCVIKILADDEQLIYMIAAEEDIDVEVFDTKEEALGNSD